MRGRNLILCLAVAAILGVGACGGLPIYVAGILCVAACVLLPRALFYAAYRRLPLARGQNPLKVRLGSTKDQVRAALGKPHEKTGISEVRVALAAPQERPVKGEARAALADPQEIGIGDPRETWYYHADPFGIVVYGMKFGKEGRLEKVWW